jgi:hypothetical protein
MINSAELPAEAKTHYDQPHKGKTNIRNKKKKKIHEVHTTHLLAHLLSCSSYNYQVTSKGNIGILWKQQQQQV